MSHNKYNKIFPVLMFLFLAFAYNDSVLAQSSVGGPGSNSGSSVGGAANPTPAPGQTNCGSSTLCNPLKVNSIGDAVNTGIEVFSYIAVLLAVIMLIWVGLQFILARGEPGRLNELKGWLLWIVVGVAIVLGARIIIQVVLNTLQATGSVSPQVINSAQNALGH